MENNEKNESIKQETVSRMNHHTILTKEITTVSLIFFLPINTKKKCIFLQPPPMLVSGKMRRMRITHTGQKEIGRFIKEEQYGGNNQFIL